MFHSIPQFPFRALVSNKNLDALFISESHHAIFMIHDAIARSKPTLPQKTMAGSKTLSAQNII